MVDFQNPTVLEEDFLAVVKFWHVVDGIFIWEFFVTLEYELSIIRGHRPYRWTIWVRPPLLSGHVTWEPSASC
jgi:hypothetical protein